MSGDRNVHYGSFVGTGSALNILVPGFKPKKVKIFNISDPVTLNWNQAMPDASGFKRVAAGTGTFITSNGITPLAGGFTVGADTDVNVSGETCHYEASE